MADFSDLNPVFASRLAQLREALNQQGIGNSLVSGYRTPEYQGQMYANHQAKVAGQPLPYPNVEAPAVVAAPWRSFHNYGLAADFNLGNPNDYARLQSMAPTYGLSGIGMSDKGHIQLGGDLASDINQYHLAGWRPASQPAPATGAIAYTGPTAAPTRVASTRPGTTLNSSPLDIVLNAESGDRNINNVHATTSSGQAQGNAQITTGTWNDFAPKAGVDLKKYPTPDSAPRAVQIAVANQIPLNRWASSTVNAVLAKYPGIDTSQPLGVIQSNAINPPGAPGSPASTTPAVAGTGGAPAAGTTLPGFQPGSPANKMAQNALKTLGGGGGGGGDEPQPPPLQMAQSQAVGGPMMMRPGGMNAVDPRIIAQQALQQQGYMTQPTLAANVPLGGQPVVPSTIQSTIQPMAAGLATGMPALPGTTLNSPSQLQMALMTGQMSPYDMYARQQGSM